MEMVHERLVARQRLELVAVREPEHRLARALGRIRTGVEIHAHVLHGARWGVEQGEVVRVLRSLLRVGLADADAEGRRRVLPVPHVAEIGVDLAREEERMRRCKGTERCALSFGHEQPILRLDRRAGVLNHAAELVVLRLPARVTPCDSRRQAGRESLQARVIFVGNPLVIGFCQRIHAKKVRAAVRRESQIAGEDAHRQPRERHLERRAVGLHAA